MRHWVLLALISCPAMVSATTLKTIMVDADLSDFDPTDRLPDDPPGDSTLAPNEVGVLYVNWDATYLYLGFDFRAASLAEVLYYIESTGTGATDLCSFGSLATAGTLAEPADLVVAFASNESSHVFSLASGFP